MLERLPLFAGTGGRRGFAGMPTLGTAARPWELAAPVEGFSATWSCAERSAADAPRAHIRKKAAEGAGRGPLATKTQYSTTSARVVNERIVPAFSAGPQSADTAALWGFWIGSQVAWVSLLKRGVSGVLCAPGKTTVQEVVGSEGFPLRANGVHQGPLRAYPEPPLCGNISVESCYQN